MTAQPQQATRNNCDSKINYCDSKIGHCNSKIPMMQQR